MLSTGTDIILRPYDPYEDHVSHSPFEAFMAALGRRYRASAKSMASAAEWTAFPYEQAVADGLWLVFIRTAERLGLKLATPDHVLREIAPRVNRVLNNGMLLVYKTTEDAAEAFDDRVAQSVARKTETTAASEAWALESATFFAEIIKTSQDLADQISRMQHKLFVRNTVKQAKGKLGGDLNIRLLQEVDFRFLPVDGPQTDPVADQLRLDSVLDPMMQRDTDPKRHLQALKRTRYFQKALELLPVRLNRIPDQVMAYLTDLSIEVHWISTQVLLAIADAPIGLEHLEAKTYLAGLNRLRKLKTEQARELFHARMKARDPRYNREQVSILDPLIDASIEEKRSWGDVLDLDTKDKMLIDILGLQIDLDIAKSMAMPADAVPLDGSDAERKLALEIIELRIQRTDWSRVEDEEFREILAQEEIPSAMLADSAHRLTPDQRGMLIETVLESQASDPEAVSKLFERSLIPLDQFYIFRWLDCIPETMLGEAFEGAVNGKPHPGMDGLEREWLPLRVLRRLPSKQAAALAAQPQYRQILGHAMLDLPRSGGTSKRPSRTMLAKHLGMKVYRQLILVSMIGDYEAAYNGEMKSVRLPTWGERFTERYSKLNPPEWASFASLLLVKNKSELAALASVYKEDTCFLWTYAGERDPKVKLKGYQQARKAYYAR